MAVQFWQVVVNAVNKHTKTDRFVRRLDIPIYPRVNIHKTHGGKAMVEP